MESSPLAQPNQTELLTLYLDILIYLLFKQEIKLSSKITEPGKVPGSVAFGFAIWLFSSGIPLPHPRPGPSSPGFA
jgi:hypothetical protein